jgi:glycosyltransferase involved in cell wall biosynthesis
LVISFNSDCREDAALIGDLPPDVPVVVHHLLRPSFLDDECSARATEVLKRAARIVTPADFMRAEIADAFGVPQSRIVAVRNGADTRTFRPHSAESCRAYRAELGVAEDSLMLAWVAQATHAKGVQALPYLAKLLPANTYLLARSFSRVRSARNLSVVPALDAVVAANPRQVRVCAEDWVQTTHPIPFADALLVTSLSEVAPLVVTEALMSGIPAVSTDCTPFYAELAHESLGSPDVLRVPLSARSVGSARANLTLTPDEARGLAQHLVAAVATLARPTELERVRRSQTAAAAGMTERAMLDRFQEVYTQAARAGAV